VLDPAYAPGTGTPEPGGMTSIRPAVGLPRDRAIGWRWSGWMSSRCCPSTSDRATITALVADRIVRETLTGLAQQRG